MSRRLAFHVHVADEHGEIHEFGPDDQVPAWAQKAISNPSAWAEEPDTEPAPGNPATEGEPVDYASWKKDQLEAEVDRRNEDREDDDLIEVEAPGNKAELVAALQADDAARAE